MIKKYLLLITLMLSFSVIANAQIKDKLFFEIDLIRFSNDLGLSVPYGKARWTYFNSIELGIELGEKINYFTKVRRVDPEFRTHGPTFVVEETQVKGLELNTGFEFVPNKKRTFHLSYGLEFFAEFSKHKGILINDAAPTYQINHKKKFLGLAPRIKFNYRLSENFSITASCRYRFGKSSMQELEPIRPDQNVYLYEPNTSYWEPLSSLALRIDL